MKITYEQEYKYRISVLDINTMAGYRIVIDTGAPIY